MSQDEFSGKKVLITGGLGFIGSNLAIKLISLDADVTLYDSMITNLGGNMNNIKEIKNRCKVVIGDIRNPKKMLSAVKGKDFIFNLAAQTNHVLSLRDPHFDTDINCLGALTLLDQCKESNPLVKIIYTGSRSQIGEPLYSPVDENHPENPLDINSANMSAAEKYHLIYNRRYGMPVVCLRLTNTYGPRHQIKHSEYGFIHWWIRKAILNDTIEVWGDGKQTRDLCYVDDVVEACILAAQKDEANSTIFNVVSGKEHKLIDIATMIIKICGSGTYELRPFPKARRSIYPHNFVGSYEKILKILGWYPRTSLKEGLEKTITFYKARFGDYV